MKRSTIARTSAAIGAVTVAAALNAAIARRTERKYPPTGRFLDVLGVKLHYTDTGGDGPAVVLLHGNGVSSHDWKLSGVVDALVPAHRVIAIDRPGFGYSERPHGTVWTPLAQADLIHGLLYQLDVGPAVVVGHSWGTLVALELAMHYPHDVKRLLLLSGYYFPTFRPDVAIFAAPALPVVGDVMRYTISPLLGRLTAPQVTAQMFAPNPVAPQFTTSLPMTLRPSQLRAAAQDTACMVPGAASAAKGYGALTMPTAIVAGRGDKIVEYTQSERLAAMLDEARLLIVEDSGHMVHYTATDTVVQTIATLAGATPSDEDRSYAGV